MAKKRSIAAQGNSDTKEKTYKKLINFYKILVDPSFLDASKTSSEIIKEKIAKIFHEQDSFKLNDIIIQNIELDDNYFFGSICRKSDLDVLTEIKNAKNDKSISNTDIIIENYTYFLINFNTLSFSVIKTKNIPKSDEFIRDFITKITLLNVTVAPFAKSESEIKSMIANSFELTFYDNSNKYIGLKETGLQDCEFKELSIKAKLKEKSGNKKIMPTLLNLFKGNSDVKSLSASTDSEDIDLLKNSFTKHVMIELSKNYKDDINKIKQVLANELFIIETQSI